MNGWDIVAIGGLIAAVCAFFAAWRWPPDAPRDEIPAPEVNPELDDVDGLGGHWATRTGADTVPAVPLDDALARDIDEPAASDHRGRSEVEDKGPGWDKTGLRDLVVGGTLLIAAALVYAISTLYMGLITSVLNAAPVAIVGGWLAKRGARRQHGLAVERRALRRLKVPAGWSMQLNVPVRGHGDADVLLVSPAGERFVVEVKSHQKITVKHGWLFGRPKITTAGGKQLPRDPLRQVASLGTCLHALPVVWFPDSQERRVTKLREPAAIIVQGPQRALLKAIGARSAWALW